MCNGCDPVEYVDPEIGQAPPDLRRHQLLAMLPDLSVLATRPWTAPTRDSPFGSCPFTAFLLFWTNGITREQINMEGWAQPEILGDLCSVLDRYHERLERVACVTVVDEMIRQLGTSYDIAARTHALSQFRAACQTHPLHRLVLEDPYTERTFSKRRRYTGDAVLLDYIYRPRPLALSDIGAVIHFMMTGASPAKSVIWRRDHLGAEISTTVRHTRSARILSVASGHLRELDLVRNMVGHRDFEIVAIDQDREALKEAVNSNPDFNIIPVNTSVARIFERQDGAKYDLIYSAGLFDYLPAKAASGLLNRLMEMLAPSGRLIVSNYAPENYGRGYMEGMMGWTLLYRNESDMERLLQSRTETDCRMYRDEPGNVVYLEISSLRN